MASALWCAVCCGFRISVEKTFARRGHGLTMVQKSSGYRSSLHFDQLTGISVLCGKLNWRNGGITNVYASPRREATSRKSVSSDPPAQYRTAVSRIPYPGRGREAHESGPARSVRSPRRDPDPDCLPARPAGNRDLRFGMVAGRVWPIGFAPCQASQERQTERSPAPGRRNQGITGATAAIPRKWLRICHRARRTIHYGRGQSAYKAHR
jgi:hypothetical protein